MHIGFFGIKKKNLNNYYSDFWRRSKGGDSCFMQDKHVYHVYLSCIAIMRIYHIHHVT